jgi:hypothetical protein
MQLTLGWSQIIKTYNIVLCIYIKNHVKNVIDVFGYRDIACWR